MEIQEIREEFKDWKFIEEIPKDDKKESVVLVGRGPSVDNLHLHIFNQQTKCDICTITDAIKLTDEPKFAFNYHDQGFARIRDYVHKPENFIIPIKLIQDMKRRKWDEAVDKIMANGNVRLFIGRNRKNLDIFTQGLFDIQVQENKLFNRHGSVVGALHFLLGYMEYKKIYYIGFDGGKEYGELVHSNRKDTKVEGAALDYAKSWETVLELVKHYDVEFKPLTQFLLRGNKKP